MPQKKSTLQSVPNPPSQIQTILSRGIPVWKAEFHTAVNNTDNTPETYFSDASNVASRNVMMWWLPEGLYCLHKGEYFVVPSAQVRFAKFKKEE